MSADPASFKETRLAEFERLVAQYEAPLLRYAGRILRDSHAAEDVVQEAFLRLLRRWDGDWTPTALLSAWLYRVTHNCAVDHMRRESRRDQHQRRHADAQLDLVEPLFSQGHGVSDEALRAQEALGSLSVREQQLVILKVFEEKSYKEISEISGLSVSNVGYILHHAMKKMADLLRSGESSGDGRDT